MRKDALAGVTTAAVVIPQSMAYATIAGLPVEVGLYTALVPLLAYATGRNLARAVGDDHVDDRRAVRAQAHVDPRCAGLVTAVVTARARRGQPLHRAAYLPEDGYHLSKDLADKALEFIRDSKQSEADKPWYLWFCPGANHAPHLAPQEYIDKRR
jgi:hypothetical protein